MEKSTIAAVSTPLGAGGIGIVKISGPKCAQIASALFQAGKKGLAPMETDDEVGNGLQLESRKLTHGYIIDPRLKQTIDEVLISFMRGPKTYTGEDVVEINSHSGSMVLKLILNAVLTLGARLAVPGEFTRRAFINGRIDLTQAEAIIDLINSKTSKALSIASSQLKGELGQSVEAIKEEIKRFLVLVEASIDFSADLEEDVLITDVSLKSLKHKVIDPLNKLLRQYAHAHFYREGLKIAIVGKPNVGKSCLLNRLLDRERAIVSEYPGTTRDLIEESVNIEGMPAVITDTAGVHCTDNPVENIGIKKTGECIDQSDLVIFLVDAGSVIDPADHEINRRTIEKKRIIAINKVDLLNEGEGISLPSEWDHEEPVYISALYGSGIDTLKQSVVRGVGAQLEREDENSLVPNLRQKIALQNCLSAIKEAYRQARQNTSPEFIAIELNDSLEAIGNIAGKTASDEIIDRVFERFCIGK